ncbi:hypothetical protein D3C87_2063620 [compost metagenome]
MLAGVPVWAKAPFTLATAAVYCGLVVETPSQTAEVPAAPPTATPVWPPAELPPPVFTMGWITVLSLAVTAEPVAL